MRGLIYRDPIAASSTSRPAHRPSRRQFVIDGALELFARSSIDDVTVQNIASAVDMTSAAVYYHFASKEQILAEAMRQYRDGLLDVLAEHARAGEATIRVVDGVLDHIEQHRTASLVYFVKSVGLNLTVEAVRRETRLLLIDEMRAVVDAAGGSRSSVEAGVMSVALVSLLETSAASLVNRDEVFTALGAEAFRRRVADLADRIAVAGAFAG